MMTKYLVSFPGPAMDVPVEEMAAVSEAAHNVIREAKDVGVSDPDVRRDESQHGYGKRKI